MKKSLILSIALLFLLFLLIFVKFSKNKVVEPKVIPTPSLPTPTPTPRPLTFAEMNALYGPCVYLPTLMYHHVQTAEEAKSKNQTNISVRTEDFTSQMQYLKDKGYTTASMSDLINFFDLGTSIPKKSILLTFDDGYLDYLLVAYPVLEKLGFQATEFVPTGLMGGYGYLSWDNINQTSARTYFANHTWSHKSVKQGADVVKNEITTADTQLSEKGLNLLKVFAYPYGGVSSQGEQILQSLNYKLAFTTNSGSTLCKKLRLELPRVRIGNGNMGRYGF